MRLLFLERHPLFRKRRLHLCPPGRQRLHASGHTASDHSPVSEPIPDGSAMRRLHMARHHIRTKRYLSASANRHQWLHASGHPVSDHPAQACCNHNRRQRDILDWKRHPDRFRCAKLPVVHGGHHRLHHRTATNNHHIQCHRICRRLCQLTRANHRAGHPLHPPCGH